MTTIAGIVHRDGSVWLGGDSCCTCGEQILIQSAPKVWRVGAFVVGACGSVPFEETLRRWRPPKSGWQTSIRKWIASVPSDEDDEVTSALVGYAGALWVLERTGYSWQTQNTFAVAGTGGDVALGVLWAVRGAPRARLLRALGASAALTPGTRPPFVVVHNDPR
jgi:hypothetical protein